MGWGKVPEVNPPRYSSCKSGEEMDVFVHPCHLAWHELGLCIQKASLYNFSDMFLNIVFEIDASAQREYAENQKKSRG